ncbi:MAG: hypothetical protein NTY19_27005 [Planctomycetota bacterium]|nr:hypothetical protein [Planctomycetota bacterium]
MDERIRCRLVAAAQGKPAADCVALAGAEVEIRVLPKRLTLLIPQGWRPGVAAGCSRGV